MATGNSADQSFQQTSGLVPTVKSFQRTLLPYERELCAAIGCSVEEYEQYLIQLEKYSYIRPAAYDRIPDIQNTGPEWAIVISLAIGLASTAASYFLMPKPRALSEDNQQRSINAPGRRGKDRFLQSTSFDGFADLAEFGSAIPIIWTKYTGTTGGVVVAPLLIWSRAYSLGNQQAAKMVYLVSEAGVSAPDIAGVFIGNTALQVQDPKTYIFRWDGRPTADMSSITGVIDQDFFACLTPSNSTQFGVGNPIPNMTPYRVNWQVVSYPEEIEEGKGENDIRNQRRKICGSPGRDAGMPGTGRNYPRRQGVVVSGGSTGTVFRISGEKLDRKPENYDKPTTITTEDINSALHSECAAADDILQVGQQLICGSTLTKVVGRSDNLWTKGKTVDVYLDESVRGGPAFHIAQRDHLATDYSEIHFPLCTATIAAFRNNRRCDATDIGIRSQVWKRVNGLANFNRVPDPDTLKDYDDDNIQFNLGTNNEYIARVSMFKIQLREVGSTTWQDAGGVIAVRGATPIDQYNQIRVVHGAAKEFEFQILPVSSGAILEGLSTVLLLKQSASIINDGKLVLRANRINVYDGNQPNGAFDAPAFITRGWGAESGNVTVNIPTTAVYNDIFCVSEGVQFRLVNVEDSAIRLQRAFFADLFGEPELIGFTREIDYVTSTSRGNLKLKIRASVVDADTTTNVALRWRLDSVTILESRAAEEGNFALGDLFTIKNRMSVDSKYLSGKIPNTVKKKRISVRLQVKVTGVKTRTLSVEERGWRPFEPMAAFAEVSHYGSLVTHSCDSGPEHEVVYINQKGGVSLGNYENVNTVALALKSNRNMGSVDQLRLWIKSGTNNSNSFPRLVQYLLERTSGINPAMIDTASFNAADSFCNANGFYYDGAITSRTNLRSFITSTAPFFLLNFVMINGKMALIPALSNASSSAMFTAGNIIEDSFNLEYLDVAERKPIRAEMIWRQNFLNEFPRNRSFLVGDGVPIETFDMSAFCTSQAHAEKAGKYICAVRKFITHSISFKTTLDNANVRPGSVITVALDQVAVSRFNNGSVSSSGLITSTSNLPNGTYEVTYFKAGNDSPQTASMTVTNGSTSDTALYGSVFSVIQSSVYTSTYVVEQVELDEEGLVSISASEYPGNSIIGAIGGIVV